MSNPVGWFEIYVYDMARANTGSSHSVMDTEGNMIGLHSMK